MSVVEIRRLSANEAARHIAGLAQVLVDCVEGGASVSFMLPFTQDEANEFFQRVIEEVDRSHRILLAAFIGQEIVGTVQIITDLPANQPHRADIAKMLVKRSARNHGIGQSLMMAAEQAAREAGKTLLVLDTVTGAAGERLYARLGWIRVGEIPNYALFPDGRPTSTTVFYRQLD